MQHWSNSGRNVFGQWSKGYTFCLMKIVVAFMKLMKIKLTWNFALVTLSKITIVIYFIFSSFYNIKFSFKEVEHSQDASRVFTIKRKKMCFLKGSSYDYISDPTGFAWHVKSSDALKLYYYGIESKFTSYIKILFFQLKYYCEIKVVNRMIWLLTQSLSMKPTLTRWKGLSYQEVFTQRINK